MDEEEMALNNDSAGTILTDSTLFSTNRLSGLDLWENGTYADYGVRWAAFSPRGDNIELFLGQSYDFTDRPSIDLNSGFHNGLSDYVGRVSYNNMRGLNIATRFRLNQQNLSLNHMETTASIGIGKNYFNIGHIWSQNLDTALVDTTDVNEAIIGASIRLSERWRLGWNSVYSMEYGQFMRHGGGVYYNHPCYYLSVEYKHDNTNKDDYVGDTTFQFKFGMAINGQRY